MAARVLITLVVAVGSVVGQQLACPLHCDCTETGGDVLALCHGDNVTLSQVVQALPLNVTNFTFVADTPAPERVNMVFVLDHPRLTLLHNLKYLTIAIGDQAFRGSHRFARRWPPQPFFEKLQNLEELRLNMKWEFADIVTSHEVTFLSRLRLLDLSYADSFGGRLLEWLPAVLAGKPLEVLRLQAVQDITSPHSLKLLDFAQLLGPLNTTRLRELDLSDNGLRDMSPGTINSLPHLTKLVLSGNFLFNRGSDSSTRAAAVEAAMHPSIEYIDFSSQHYGASDLPKDDVDEQCKQIQENILQLWTNHSAACRLARCLLHDTSGVMPCRIFTTISEILDFSCFDAVQFPLGPRLRELHLDQLYFGRSWRKRQRYSHFQKFCFHPNNSLEVIDIGGTPLLEEADWSDATVSGLEHLRILDMSHLHTTFTTNSLFAGFPNLQELYLEGNTVRLDLDTDGTFFQPNSKLQLLDLSDCEIATLHSLHFAHLPQLKVLDLGSNYIEDVNFTLPSSTSASLQLLKLDANNITAVSREFLSDLDQHGARLSIDLSANSLGCSCQELYLVQWIQQTDVNLLSKETYQCQTDNGDWQNIDSIDLKSYTNKCNPSITQAVVGATVSVAVFVIVCVLVTLTYRKRWLIRYCFYRFSKKQDAPQPMDNYRYDGFVSYHSDDKGWVHHTLREEIEDRRHLRLFIYMRDLLGGGSLDERLHDAMAECRRILFVLSPNFLASEFCMYELHKARSRLMAEGLDVLILVVLEDLPLVEVPGILTAMLQTTDYLKWTEDEAGQKLFWDKLERWLLTPPERIIRDAKHGGFCC